MQPYELTYTQMADKLRSGELGAVELTESAIARVEAVEDKIHALATFMPEIARAQAKRAQDEIARGEDRGPLHGIPVGVKDLIDTAGVRTTSSSRVRENYVPDTDAAVVTRLAEAGAVMIGKTHTHEFAYGVITPTTRNPWDTARVPGGSSGGSGAGIAAGYFPIALGSDTGGSIRIPGSVCGTVGLKPTFGRVSRVGVASLSWSLDHIGPLSRNVADAAHALNVLAGYDPRDPGSAERPADDYTSELARGVEGVRIGVPTNYFNEAVDPEVLTAAEAGVALLRSLGAEVREVTVPMAEAIMPTEFAILLPEASAYHREALRATPELFGEDVRVNLEVGETVLATTYIDALRVREQIKRGWQAMYADVDVVIAPTTIAPALLADDPVYTHADGSTEGAMSAYVRPCVPADITGMPSLQLPSGYSASGLPLGMQIMGRPFDEVTVLRVGAAYESATDVVGRLANI